MQDTVSFKTKSPVVLSSSWWFYTMLLINKIVFPSTLNEKSEPHCMAQDLIPAESELTELHGFYRC